MIHAINHRNCIVKKAGISCVIVLLGFKYMLYVHILYGHGYTEVKFTQRHER